MTMIYDTFTKNHYLFLGFGHSEQWVCLMTVDSLNDYGVCLMTSAIDCKICSVMFMTVTIYDNNGLALLWS